MTPSRSALAALLLFVLAGPASADDYFWNGSVSTSWQSVVNFNTFDSAPPFNPTARSNPPQAGDRVRYNNLATANRNNTLDDTVQTGISILGIVVGNNVPGAVSIAQGVGGSNLTLGASGIDMTVANVDLTITAPVVVGVNQTWAVNSGRTLTLSGAVTATGRTLNLNQDTAGTTGFAGTVVLSNAGNTFAGSTVNLRGGVLQLSSLSALGGGANGVAANPLSGGNGRAVVVLPTAGSYSSVPLTLTSTGIGLTGTLRGTVAGTTGWVGAVAVNGGAATVNELDAGTGNTLAVSGGVQAGGLGFTGTLALTGAGLGQLSTARVNLPGATVAKQGAGVWEVNFGTTNPVTNNVWTTTAVQAGRLRVGASGALPASAAAALGANGTTGVLELNADQAVAGLSTTSDDTQVNPTGNRLGAGDVQVGPGLLYTLSVTGGTTTYRGLLVDKVGTATDNRALALAVSGGNITLSGANTYTGSTTISGSGGVALATYSNATPGGPYTTHGSFANSPTVTLSSATSGLTATGLTGGANFDAVSGRFAPAANQTILGLGTITGNVTVPSTATLRGGTTVTPTGTLSVVGNLQFNGGGKYAVDLNNSTSGPSAGKIAVTGVVNFNTAGGPVVIPLLNDANIAFDTSVSYIIGSATGGYQLNGNPIGAGGYTYPTDFTLSSTRPGLTAFQNVSLTPSGSNLQLSFTPVPEPATVLGLAAVGLGAVRLARRRILAGRAGGR